MHHQRVGGRDMNRSKPESWGQDDGHIKATFSYIVNLKLPGSSQTLSQNKRKKEERFRKYLLTRFLWW